MSVWTNDEFVGIAVRAAAGGALAAAIGVASVRARSLTKSGALAVTLVGALANGVSWQAGILLIPYFAAAVGLSRMRNDARRTDDSSPRSARQVIANGGVYAVACLGALVFAGLPLARLLMVGGIGALSASSADTWATEIGTRFGGPPRLFLSRTLVREGTSGGVSSAGFAAAVGGAAFVAVIAALLGLTRGAALAPLVAGFMGASLDSALGEFAQERRRCDGCDATTERRRHICGADSRRISGIPGVDNDVVNLFATFGGFIVSFALAVVMRGVG